MKDSGPNCVDTQITKPYSHRGSQNTIAVHTKNIWKKGPHSYQYIFFLLKCFLLTSYSLCAQVTDHRRMLSTMRLTTGQCQLNSTRILSMSSIVTVLSLYQFSSKKNWTCWNSIWIIRIFFESCHPGCWHCCCQVHFPPIFFLVFGPACQVACLGAFGCIDCHVTCDMWLKFNMTHTSTIPCTLLYSVCTSLHRANWFAIGCSLWGWLLHGLSLSLLSPALCSTQSACHFTGPIDLPLVALCGAVCCMAWVWVFCLHITPQGQLTCHWLLCGVACCMVGIGPGIFHNWQWLWYALLWLY